MTERSRVLELLKRHGWNATSFQVLEPGFRYWFDGDDACVAYVESGKSFVAAGAPIAPESRLSDVAVRFCEWARSGGRRACFFATEQRFAGRVPFGSMRIGEQPVWDPSRWEDTLASSRSLREQLRRARAKGIRVRAVDSEALADPRHPAHSELEGVVQRWLQSRPMASMGFLVQLHLQTFATERWCLVAERDGRIVGLLHAVPVYARRGWLFEDLLRDPHAPNGTTELLVDAGMRVAAEAGGAFVTLGLAPLAGANHAWAQVARSVGRALYDFEGLRAFKAKLRPHQWSPIFLTAPRDTRPWLAMLDCLRAFTSNGFVQFGLATLVRAKWLNPVLP